MEFEAKAHPLMIFRFIKPLIFVAVIPLVRALIQYLVAGSISGLLGLESASLGIITVVAVAQWRSISVTVCDGTVSISRGVIIKSSAQIELKNFQACHLKKTRLTKFRVR